MSAFARWTMAIREFIVSTSARLLLPELRESSAREDETQPFSTTAEQDGPSAHVLVQDNGASITIFSFSSTMLLFASQPTFEFQGFFDNLSQPCNRVFFRDTHRCAYHVHPDGAANGREFFENEVRHYMETLGSTINIALGDSSGGSAAIYFGSRCGMQKIIALSPAFPLRTWINPPLQCRYLFNLRRLKNDWPAYREGLVLLVSTPVLLVDLLMRVGIHGIWKPMEVFRNTTPRPEATIFYGEQSDGDCRNAHRIADLPGVKLVPLQSARHSIGLFMARKGILQKALVEEIETFLDRSRTDSIQRTTYSDGNPGQ